MDQKVGTFDSVVSLELKNLAQFRLVLLFNDTSVAAEELRESFQVGLVTVKYCVCLKFGFTASARVVTMRLATSFDVPS